ncbi:MAG TPA: PorV/PorQ family protein [Acidobacteriota bacterium]|nr:PorV/PorQ family protein [Acidobacteriota bacterium]
MIQRLNLSVRRRGACVVSVIGIAILFGVAPANAGDPGEAAYSFLNIGTDARAEGMGGAHTAVADGVGGVFYNPAALAEAIPGDFTASYVNWVTDIQSGFLAAVWGVGTRERMAAAVQYLDFGDFRGFDPYGVPTADFGASDFALAVHGAGMLGRGFHWGVAGRMISESIDGESSIAFAADAGVLYRLGDQRTRVGAAVRNLGVQSSNFGSAEKDDLPITLRLGLSHSLRGMPLLMAADVFKPSDDDLSLAVGLEYAGLESARFRVGYNTLVGKIDTNSDRDDFAGLTLGVGFILSRIAIDYAYGSLSELGDAHRFTLRSGF